MWTKKKYKPGYKNGSYNFVSFFFFLNSAIKCLQYLQKQVFSITAVVSNTSLLKERYEDNFSM